MNTLIKLSLAYNVDQMANGEMLLEVSCLIDIQSTNSICDDCACKLGCSKHACKLGKIIFTAVPLSPMGCGTSFGLSVVFWKH